MTEKRCPYCGQPMDLSARLHDHYIKKVAPVDTENATLLRADGWISVNDRLPELDSYGFHDGKVFFYSGEVLVCKAGEKWKFLATYDELYGWISDIGDRLAGITHWMDVEVPPLKSK